jgi:hypothetical protein
MQEKVFLNRKQASDRLKARGLKIEPTTLAKYATTGGGPPFQKWSRTPVYDPEMLDQWAEQRLGALRHSSSDEYAGPRAA